MNREVRQPSGKSRVMINPIQTRLADWRHAQRCRTPRLVALTSSVRGPWPTWPESTVRTGPEPNGTLPRASGLAGGAFLRWAINFRRHHRAGPPAVPFVGLSDDRRARPSVGEKVYRTKRRASGSFCKSSWFLFAGSRMRKWSFTHPCANSRQIIRFRPDHHRHANLSSGCPDTQF